MAEYRIDAKNKNLKTVNQEIGEAVKQGKTIFIENAENLHGLAAGLKEGTVTVEGNVGDYIAALNDGATIIVNGNAGKFAADNMTRGKVIVVGDAEYGAGEYCYGGVLVVKGNAGDFLGALNKGAAIIVMKNAGNDVGTYMVGGDIIIIEEAGENLGNYFIRGNIYVGDKWSSLGHNCKKEKMVNEDVKKLAKLFKENHIDVDPKSFQKFVPKSIKPFY